MTFVPVLFSVLLAMSLAATISLVTLSLRGRLVPCPPVCARCRHQVGTGPDAEQRPCAECGAPLDGADAIRYFRWRWRPRLVVAALVVAATATGAFTLAFATFNTRLTPPQQAVVVAALVEQLGTDTADAWRALNVLAARAPTMADDELRETVAGMLAAHRRGGLRWSQAEIAVIAAAARQRRMLDDTDYADIADIGTEPLALNVPAIVRAGNRLQVWTGGSSRQIASTRDATLVSLSVSGRELPLECPIPELCTATFGLDVGDYELVATIRTTYALTPPSGSIEPVTVERRLAAPIRIHPSDAPSWIEPIIDEGERRNVEAAVRATVASIDERPDGSVVVRCDCSVLPTSIPLGFETTLEIGGVTIPLGDMWSVSRDSTATWSSGHAEIRWPEPLPPAATATVVFTPSQRLLEPQPRVMRIWGDAIRIEVPVVRGHEPTLPRVPGLRPGERP